MGQGDGRTILESTADLLQRVRAGDPAAVQRLVAIYRPVLERWAHGRLPARARGLVETSDLVQVSLLRVLKQVDEFDVRRPGAFLAYLRRTLLNALRNEIRNAGRRPAGEPIEPSQADPGPSPLEEYVGRDAIVVYERALAELTEQQQQAVILRLEFGLKHGEIAEALGCPSANAARMVLSRAMVRLTELMDKGVVGP